jgi:hypothetical protein
VCLIARRAHNNLLPKVRRPLFKFVCRVDGKKEWLTGTMDELEYPPADIEPAADLITRVNRAHWRFEDRAKKAMRSFSSASNAPLE